MTCWIENMDLISNRFAYLLSSSPCIFLNSWTSRKVRIESQFRRAFACELSVSHLSNSRVHWFKMYQLTTLYLLWTKTVGFDCIQRIEALTHFHISSCKIMSTIKQMSFSQTETRLNDILFDFYSSKFPMSHYWMGVFVYCTLYA